MSIHNIKIIMLGFATAIASMDSTAQQTAKASLADVVKLSSVDMPMGTSPATFLLGASGENVPRVTSFRELFTQAGRAVDEKGKIANALSVEVAPAFAIGDGLDWESIRASRWVEAWSRTTISLATKVKSEDSPAQSAIGLQVILYAPAMDDARKSAADSENCKAPADEFIRLKAQPPPGPGTKPPPLTAAQEASKAQLETCAKDLSEILGRWNQSMVAAGAGRVFSSGAASSDKSKEPSAVWLSAALGGDYGNGDIKTRTGYLLTGHLRHNQNVAVLDYSGAEVQARQRLAGVNLRFGNAKFAGLAEVSLAKYDEPGRTIKDRKRGVLGFERKFRDDLYLTVGIAKDSGAPQDKTSVFGRLQWGFGDKPTLGL